MRQKITTVCLISLFAWNAVFGAFGGLLLCIHDEALHLETPIVTDENTCSDDCGSEETATESAALGSNPDDCVDITLIGESTPLPRLEGLELLKLKAPTVVRWATSATSFSNPKIATSASPRGPPNVDTSGLLIVRTQYLRI